ncbi:MAG: cytochrome C oxidase subunit IV family protein [Phycisphaerae bacterium]
MSSHSHPAATRPSDYPAVGHLVPVWVLCLTALALTVLTVVTVAVRYIDLGEFNIWIAMIIATIKAALVCMYFMHLRYDRPFNALVLIFATLFMLLFIGFLLTDTAAYRAEMVPPTSKEYAPGITRMKQ